MNIPSIPIPGRLRPTAAIATTALIDTGIVTEDSTCKVLEKSKIKRVQEELMTEQMDTFNEKCREEGGISYTRFDGWIDLTDVFSCKDQGRTLLLMNQAATICLILPQGQRLHRGIRCRAD